MVGINLVKCLILLFSISYLIQNVLSDTQMKLSTVDFYTSFDHWYDIGSTFATDDTPLKFNISLDRWGYQNTRDFEFCFCYPSTEPDTLNKLIQHCKSTPNIWYGRLCLYRGEWYTNDVNDGKAVDIPVKYQQVEKIDIEISFEDPDDDSNNKFVKIYSEKMDPKSITLKYKSILKKPYPNNEKYCQIGAYSNNKQSIEVFVDESNYHVIPKVVPPGPTNPRPPPPAPKPEVPVTLPKASSSSTPPAATDETSSASTIYIVLGIILGLIVLIIIIIVVLYCIQGVWLCGLCGKKKKRTDEEDIPPETVVAEINNVERQRVTRSTEDKRDSQQPSSTQPEAGQEQPEQQKEKAPPPPLPPPPPAPASSTQGKDTQEKVAVAAAAVVPAKKAVVSRDTKDVTTDEKTSDSDGATTGGATTGATTNAPPEKKKKKAARVPNMLLVATKEEDTQSEGGQIPSKRKTKVAKDNKEPAATKNFTQDPTGAVGTKTGKPVTTSTHKTGIAKKTEGKTGYLKAHTDLATGTAVTKGVSATQGGDKETENYETGPTQKGTTMATGAGKATTLGTTQLGTQTTQGGATTAGGGEGKTKTGIGKTRLTGATQVPTADTNETQIPTGATKTKATQLATGATQKASTGTTQAGTGTTQRGTTIATGKTQGGTAGTQAQTGGTRQTGETQNPDDTDIDFTQVGGTAASRGGTGGGTRPTQLASDADADPTQNPTALTGGGIKTSKTQLGATGGTKTRTTQKQTKQTDAL